MYTLGIYTSVLNNQNKCVVHPHTRQLSIHTSYLRVGANCAEVRPAKETCDIQRRKNVDGLAQAVHDEPDLHQEEIVY